MSGVIIYRSNYGSTKQYAEWIAEETGFSIHDSRDTAIPWAGADLVVIGCPIVANRPILGGWIEKNWDRMKRKNVVLFTTSGADPAKEPVREWVEKALPDALRPSIRVFPLAGRFRYADMNGLHKAMIWFAANVLRNPGVRHQIANPIDGVARENLTELVAFLAGTA